MKIMSPPLGATKQDARITKTRQKVLDKGVQVLFTDGWEQITHLRLAKDTGIARGTLYRHWPTIDDLILEIFETCAPAPNPPSHTGNLQDDLLTELAKLSDDLDRSKLGDIILNAARLAKSNAKISTIHKNAHIIIIRPFITVLAAHNMAPPTEIIAQMLVGPVLYHHLFTAAAGDLNLAPIVDGFLAAIVPHPLPYP